MSARIRVVVADDHLVYRAGIRSLLAAVESDIEIVGEAADGDAAVRAVAELGPDVVLMDLKMPGLGGIDATRIIATRHPATHVLVLTMFDDESVVAAVRAGARGYLLKDATVDEIERAVRAVRNGELILAPSAAARLGDHLSGSRAVFPGLTERETEVLEQLVLGRDNAQIARVLGISPKTVRNVVSLVLAKLGAENRAQAIVRVHDAGGLTGRPDSRG